MSGRDVEKRLSVLEAELKSLQTQPSSSSEGRYQEMAKLIRVYEAKLFDVMNEKKKLERYSESLESQICELVNMAEEVRDIRYILKKQQTLEETLDHKKKELEEFRLQRSQGIEQEVEKKAREIAEQRMREVMETRAQERRQLELLSQKYQADFTQQLESLRSQYKSQVAILQQQYEQSCRDFAKKESELREQLEHDRSNADHARQLLQDRNSAEQALRQNLAAILKPIITIALCKARETD